MSRYRPLHVPKQTPTIEIGLESLRPLMSEIERTFAEINILEKLSTQLAGHKSKTVTSAEQLAIKSTITTIVGRQTTLALSVEASRISPNFNISISQEGVKEMLSNALSTLVKKVKEFFTWLGGLIKKFFGGNAKKAKECEEASKREAEFKKKVKEQEEALRKAERDQMNENLKRKKEEELEKVRAYNDHIETLKHTHTRISQQGAGKGFEFVIRHSAKYPFKTPKELNDFLTMVNGGLIKTLHAAMTEGSFKDGGAQKALRRLNSDASFKKFFEEVEYSSESYTFKMIRVDGEGEDLVYQPSDLGWLLYKSALILDGLPTFLKRCEANENRLITELRVMNLNASMGTDDDAESSRERFAEVKEWLKLNASLTRLLVDVNRVILHLADEGLAAFNEIVK